MPSVRPSHRSTRVVVVVAAAAAAVALTFAGVMVATAPTAVAEIDGTPITSSELAFATELVERDVQNAGGSDADLRDAAIQLIRRDHAFLDLARQQGVATYRGLDDVLADREATNAQRAQSAADGEVVYGTVEYTPAEFYGKTFADLREAVIRSLLEAGDPALQITDAEIAARFDAEPAAWSDGVTTLQLTTVRLPDLTGSLDQAAMTQRVAGTAFDELTGLSADAVRSSTSVALQSPEAAAWNPRVLEQLAAVGVGGVVGPEPDQGGWLVLRVDAATVDRAAALERYGSSIRTVLVDEAFDRLVESRRSAQRVDLR